MATRTEEIGRTKTCQKCKKGHFDTVRKNFAVPFDVPTGRLCKNIKFVLNSRQVFKKCLSAEGLLSSQDRARAKENAIYPLNLFLFRKKELERERERERESFNDGREQSRTLRLATLHRGVQPATESTIFYRAGAEELKNAIYSPQLFFFERQTLRGLQYRESSRKNLNILRPRVVLCSV